MITKVNKIKDFGVFRNFSWQVAIPEFKQFNLIYGWNYSGKTTFSRMFRCFELSALHENYLAATFEVEDEQGNKFDQTFTTPPVIRVFNSDFIRKNLQWENENIEPIFMLGEENVELQKKLADKKLEIEIEEASLISAINATQGKSSSIEQKLTDKARTVSEFYSWRSFTKMQFRPLVEEVKDTISENTLNPTNLDKYKSQALSSEIKPIISKINFTVAELTTIKGTVETILQKQVTAKTIQKLLDNAPLSNWVETGTKLHVGKTGCEYCENTISTERIEALNNHFSKDYDNLKTSINTKISELENALIKPAALSEATAFYTDIQSEYKPAKTTIEKELANFNLAINSLITDLKAKKEKPFDRLEVTVSNDNKTTLESAITVINYVIEKNNKRTREFDDEKSAAIEKLKYHYACEFETQESYSQTLSDVASENRGHETSRAAIEVLKAEKLAIENQLSETVKGAETVNSYLKIFFGKDDIEIKVISENKFILLREQHEAKNLSEGEKTAIAFAYFTAKLEERNNKIIDSIIYIDDPISSLDANHLFNLYSFIRNKYEVSKQLFISTHSFELFNLMKDWFDDIESHKKNVITKWSCYIIDKTKTGNLIESKISLLPKLLYAFNSEYHYLFNLLKKYHDNPSEEMKEVYNLPNIARRYLEAFLGFKVPKSSAGMRKKLPNLIEDGVQRERVWKFVNHFSHNDTIQRTLVFPDQAECSEIIKIIFDNVALMDKPHYDIMVDEVNQIA